jgi:SAM-dependent methyltransferase
MEPTMDQATLERRVAEHYAQRGLERTILDALVAAGKDPDRLAPIDLAPIDEFHTGGRDATSEIAAQLAFARDAHILDVGCGIGGASRFFAEQHGCRVTGIDITEDFIRTAEALARRVGLGERVAYRHASALALPFEPQTFDGAYMMHVGMNIADKPALFAEVRRVLKKGAAFGVYDVVHTGKGDVGFPLPCALTPETCFVVGAADYRRELAAAGFQIEQERDRLEVARAFFRQERARAANGDAPSPLGIHILLKHDAPRILANVLHQFDEGVLAPIEIMCRAS